MNKFILPAVAAIAFVFTPTTPAKADVSVRLGNGGVVVRDRNHDRDWERERHYREYHRHYHHDDDHGPRYHHHD